MSEAHILSSNPPIDHTYLTGSVGFLSRFPEPSRGIWFAELLKVLPIALNSTGSSTSEIKQDLFKSIQGGLHNLSRLELNLSNLRHNWDGHGAPAISPMSLQIASNVNFVVSATIPGSTVFPTRAGTVQFEADFLNEAFIDVECLDNSVLVSAEIGGKYFELSLDATQINFLSLLRNELKRLWQKIHS